MSDEVFVPIEIVDGKKWQNVLVRSSFVCQRRWQKRFCSTLLCDTGHDIRGFSSHKTLQTQNKKNQSYTGLLDRPTKLCKHRTRKTNLTDGGSSITKLCKHRTRNTNLTSPRRTKRYCPYLVFKRHKICEKTK